MGSTGLNGDLAEWPGFGKYKKFFHTKVSCRIRRHSLRDVSQRVGCLAKRKNKREIVKKHARAACGAGACACAPHGVAPARDRVAIADTFPGMDNRAWSGDPPCMWTGRGEVSTSFQTSSKLSGRSPPSLPSTEPATALSRSRLLCDHMGRRVVVRAAIWHACGRSAGAKVEKSKSLLVADRPTHPWRSRLPPARDAVCCN
jgi:hypothetical protein